jgi:hypothetical protein
MKISIGFHGLMLARLYLTECTNKLEQVSESTLVISVERKKTRIGAKINHDCLGVQRNVFN